jgi:hypothetical protein
MALPDQFLRRRSTLAYFTKETGNTANYEQPSSTDAIVTVDPIDLNQALNFTDLNEVGTRLLNMQSVLNYGERTDASFQVISKIADGALPLTTYTTTGGSTVSTLAPAEHFLLMQLMGDYREYTANSVFNASTAPTGARTFGSDIRNCVSYSFKDVGTTFQIAQLVNGHMLKCAHGSILSGGSLNISREGAMTWELNSRSAQISYSGSAAIDMTATAADNVNNNLTLAADTDGADLYATAGNFVKVLYLDIPSGIAADVFKPGDRFKFVDGSPNPISGDDREDYDFNNSAYLEVFAASKTSNDITIGPAGGAGTAFDLATNGTHPETGKAFQGLGLRDDTYIVPVLAQPDMTSQPAEVIPQGNALVYMGARDATTAQLFNDSNKFFCSDFTMTIDKNLGDPGVGELNGSMYPAPVYVAQDYSVSGTMSMVIRPKDLYRFKNSLEDYDKSIGVRIECPNSLDGTAPYGGGDKRYIYIVLRSVRISFEGSEMEGAEGASLSWMLTKGGSSITSDSDLMEIIYA